MEIIPHHQYVYQIQQKASLTSVREDWIKTYWHMMTISFNIKTKWIAKLKGKSSIPTQNRFMLYSNKFIERDKKFETTLC